MERRGGRGGEEEIGEERRGLRGVEAEEMEWKRGKGESSSFDLCSKCM